MSHDGADVAAALQTIREIGDVAALDQAIDLAFPGSRITVESEGGGRLGLRLHQHGLLRPLIITAAASSQIIAVSHSQTLINALHRATEETGTPAGTIELVKDFGETHVSGQAPLDEPAWHWPKR
jgi:predicted ATPase